MLGPILYLLYTADRPTARLTVVATFADETAVLASHTDPTSVSKNLQINLNKIQDVKEITYQSNETKFTHVTHVTLTG